MPRWDCAARRENHTSWMKQAARRLGLPSRSACRAKMVASASDTSTSPCAGWHSLQHLQFLAVHVEKAGVHARGGPLHGRHQLPI